MIGLPVSSIDGPLSSSTDNQSNKFINYLLKTKQRSNAGETFVMNSLKIATTFSTTTEDLKIIPYDNTLIKLWGFPMKLGQIPFIWAFPFYFNKQNTQNNEPKIVRVKYYKICVCFIIIQVILKFLIIWKMFQFLVNYNSYYDNLNSESFYPELFHAIFLTTFFCFSTICQLHLIYTIDKWEYYINCMVKLFVVSRKSFKL